MERTRRPYPLFASVCVLIIQGFALEFVHARAADDPLQFFENHVRPLLVDRCLKCHGASEPKGGLRLDTREGLMKGGESGPAVVPKDSAQSLLMQAVRRENGLEMPPSKALDAEQVAVLDRWVRDGAVWPESMVLAAKGARIRSGAATDEERAFWSFQPVHEPAVPAVPGARIQNPIDNFIQARLAKEGLTLRAPAEKRTLLRRATFDLTGLAPTPEQIEAFLADDSPDAFGKVIDRLLKTEAYGERWGRHWLDVVRYADTAGETADYPLPLAWKYRNYVVEAFRSDKPYDQFLREQIAGDILAQSAPTESYAELVTATGFIALSRRFGFDSENYHHLTIQDSIDTIGQAMLGMSLGCARCHDHKFDPVTTQDYYGLYGIFESTRYAFPGSEQKQRVRAMVPLVNPAESSQRWAEFEARVADLSEYLSKQQLPVPNATLRSLDEMDGDFELQAPAAGGSRGVVVPPWQTTGPVSVTTAAQSPYKNRYAGGRVGVTIPAGKAAYEIKQSLRVTPRGGKLYVNFDVRLGSDGANDRPHRLSLGFAGTEAAVAFDLTPGSLLSATGEKIVDWPASQWHNVQVELDLAASNGTIRIGQPGQVQQFPLPLKPQTPFPNQIRLDAAETSEGQRATLEVDNIVVQNWPLSAVSTEPVRPAESTSRVDVAAMKTKLTEIAGRDGEFEFQTAGTPPSAPWGPGPNSVVKIQPESQSPFHNIYPAGTLGIHMPNRPEYDGFGMDMAASKPAETEQLHATFDFRCANADRGGDGSWRYYLGHGPGNSAAIELYFNGREFFRRSGDARDAVAPLKIGEWYQVQVTLDRPKRTYHGTLSSVGSRVEFSGEVTTGWDGTIDYTFIDSYGHLGGVRPALDADNFTLSDQPLPALDAAAKSPDPVLASRREEGRKLKTQIDAQRDQIENAKRDLTKLLVDGPFPMAYAVAEGTPHDVAIHVRGEPIHPGEITPRGFVSVLAGDAPLVTHGSGRLELAQWLTRPDHPLTARVMVNRIWQHHFGRGIVASENDFGVRGERPTHPELLDWLASQFVKQGWSIQQMHRLMMLSATYQQASGDDPRGREIDPEAKLLWRFNRRRLSAEEIRDAMLQVSGDLDPSIGEGHPFPSPETWGFSQHAPYYGVYPSNRRSLYLMQQRLKRHPFLGLFDGADPNVSTAHRVETTVPTQALFLMNSEFVYSCAASLTKHWLTDHAPTDAELSQLFVRTIGRPAAPGELADAREFVSAYAEELATETPNQSTLERTAAAWNAFVRTMLTRNEFLFVE